MSVVALTEEQAEELWAAVDAVEVANPYALPPELARALVSHPSFQSVIRAELAEAWRRGAQWAAVECGVIVDEAQGWATDEDNPHMLPEGGGS